MNAAADRQGIRSAYVRKVVVVERAQILVQWCTIND